MKQLSGLDATFLYLETPETPMHVGSLHLFDLPKGFKGDFFQKVKKHVGSRLHLSPLFRRKLALMPFELANPVWVIEDAVDLDYHVRQVLLPRPGTFKQLEASVGKLHASLIDRRRPLWEIYIIEGLNTGQVGFYFKIHHAAIDGAAGVAACLALLDSTPRARQVAPPPERSEDEHAFSAAELLQNALSNTVAQYAKLVNSLPQAVKSISSLVLPPRDAKGKRQYNWLKNLSLGPKTPLNVAVTDQRAFAAASIPLAEVKALAKHFSVTINDIVLALCGGALRHYLEKGRGEESSLPKKSLIAAVPVSLREPGDTETNNQVAMMLCNLATAQADPLKRLLIIQDSTNIAKESLGRLKPVLSTDLPSFGAPWFINGIASLYGRSKLADTLPPIANVVISNLPGPQIPLYLAGAKMATYYPLSIVVHGIALNITVISYNGALEFGFVACRDAIPDLNKIAKYLIKSHAELKKHIA